MEAFLMPGQGAQKPGLLAPWLKLPQARQHVAAWSARCGLDLLSLGTVADAATMTDTALTQPLLTATALLALTAVPESPDPRTRLAAGHSVGELAALAAAGVIAAEDAVALAAVRGRAMAEACALEPTGMAAILGGTPATVAQAVADADLELANVNGAGQVVVAGAIERIDALVATPPPAAKVKKLTVAGAFHTRFMASATTHFTEFAGSIDVHDPRWVLLSNVDGRVVGTGAEALALLAAQITRPVRWDLCMESMQRLGVTSLRELPPAGTLTGIARRALPHLPVTGIQTPEQFTFPGASLR